MSKRAGLKVLHTPMRGFSLIELVLIIVIVSVAAVGLLSLYSGVGRSAGVNEDAQTAAQLAQDKVEQILADRRNPARGFAWIVAANYPAENPVPGFTAFNRSVAISDIATNPPCPVAAVGTCRQVVVSVTKGLATPARIVFMVVNY